MVRLTTQYPEKVGLIGGKFSLAYPNIDTRFRPYVIGSFVFALENSEESQVRAERISTTASKMMSGENDCRHVKCQGSCRRVLNNWYEIISGDANRLDGCTVRLKHSQISYAFQAALILSGSTLLQGPNVRYEDFETGDFFRRYIFTENYAELQVESDRSWKLVFQSHVIYENTYSGYREDLGITACVGASGANIDNQIIDDHGDYWRPDSSPSTLSYLGNFFLPSDKTIDYYLSLAHERFDYGDLTRKAASSIRALDINSIAYLKDFTELASLARSLTSLLGANYSAAIKNLRTYQKSLEKEITSGSTVFYLLAEWKRQNKALGHFQSKRFKKYAKGLSSTYLASHYGVKLSILDTIDIADAIDNLDIEAHRLSTAGASMSREIDTPTDHENSKHMRIDDHVKIVYKSYDNDDINAMESARNALRMWYDTDFVPTWSNLWDLVPFSFIFDWFIPVGDYLEKRETNQYAAYLNVVKACYSSKLEWYDVWRFQDSSYNWFTSFSTRVYTREVRPDIIVTAPRYDRWQIDLWSLGHHWLEAGAIATNLFL